MAMGLVSLPEAIAGLLALIVGLILWRARSSNSEKSKRMSPPEPAGAWPFIGHLRLLGGKNTVARTLAAIADKHGPIFTVRLGVYPAVVVSSWEAVKECFTTNDKVLASRPVSTFGDHLSYGYAGFGFAPYGPYWREMRKMVVLQLLSSSRLDKLSHIRASQVEAGIRELHSLAKNSHHDSGAEVVLSQWIERLILNIVVKMIAGKSYDSGGGHDEKEDEEALRFRRVVKEFMHVAGEFVLSDFVPIPLLGWIDLGGQVKSMKRISKEMDAIFENWIGEHEQRKTERNADDAGDFIDVLLSAIEDESIYGHTRRNVIKATILTIMAAGTDTTSVHLVWVMALLLNNRHALKCAQEEIDRKVGRDRWVKESDIKKLEYLHAIIKEALRLYPPGPISVPHEAMEDCEVGGYRVAKATRLMVNVWKLHRDPRIWSDPDKFMPERFLNNSRHEEVDIFGKHPEFSPFGMGRRSCPGIIFAMQVTHLTVARLLQGFHLATPADHQPLDMTEGLGMTLPKATPLHALLTPRLASQLYQN